MSYLAIKKGDIIKVEYEGILEDGTLFDSTEKNGGVPLKFEVGAGEIIKGFDDAVLGKEVGDELDIRIDPENAYGERKSNMMHKISLSQFPYGDPPVPGKMMILMNSHGHQMFATVTKVGEKDATLDLNHPLAGKVLNFKIKILETGCEPDPPQIRECGQITIFQELNQIDNQQTH